MHTAAAVDDDVRVDDGLEILFETWGWTVETQVTREAFLNAPAHSSRAQCLVLDPYLSAIKGSSGHTLLLTITPFIYVICGRRFRPWRGLVEQIYEEIVAKGIRAIVFCVVWWEPLGSMRIGDH